MASWYYIESGRQTGPIDEAQLREMMAAGKVAAPFLVWRDGMAAWQPASTVAELSNPSHSVAQSGWHYTISGQQQAPVDQGQLVGMLAAGQVSLNELVWTEGMPNWLPANQVPALSSQINPGAPASYPGYAPAQQMGFAPPQAYNYINYSTPNQTNNHATLALVSMILGLCSFVVGAFLTGIAALICGWIALNGMKRTGNYQNKGYAITGVVIGGFWAIVLLGFIVFVVVVVSMGK